LWRYGAGHHRGAGPFTPRAGGLAAASSSYASSGSVGARVVKGVPPPKWADKARFEPSLGGTTSGKQTRMQAYKVGLGLYKLRIQLTHRA
jgi:hypothetical protein